MDIVVCGPINKLGYGVVCANLVHALSKYTDVGLAPIGHEITPEDVHTFPAHVKTSIYNAYANWQDSRIRNTKPHLHIWHEWELGGTWTGPTIGMPFFETEPIQDRAVSPITKCDLVIAPSAWAKTVIEQSVPSARVKYCKCVGYDPLVFYPKELRRKPYLLHVGKLEIRKGIDLVLKAFGRIYTEFPDIDLYCLVENMYMPRWYGVWLELLSAANIDNDTRQRVFTIRPRETAESMATLYRRALGAVQPSRGEGWGLPAMEMLACGTPVAATGNTGHAEFVRDMGAIVIPSGSIEKANDGFFFDGTRNWRSVSVDAVEAGMRTILTTPSTAISPPALTWDAGAQRLVTLLKKEKMF